jgi:hypothetical protein
VGLATPQKRVLRWPNRFGLCPSRLGHRSNIHLTKEKADNLFAIKPDKSIYR